MFAKVILFWNINTQIDSINTNAYFIKTNYKTIKSHLNKSSLLLSHNLQIVNPVDSHSF